MILQHPHNYQSQLSIMKKILNFVLTIVSSKVCVIAKYCIVFFFVLFYGFLFCCSSNNAIQKKHGIVIAPAKSDIVL